MKSDPPPPVINPNAGPEYEAGVAYWENEFRKAIAAGELTCLDCAAPVVLDPQPDGRELIVCSKRCRGN